MFEDEVAEGDAGYVGGKVVVVVTVVDCEVTLEVHDEVAEHGLGEVHELVVVGVGPVEFEHGEFGVVLGRHAFVAEVFADFVDAFEAADHEAFEVEFIGDAEVELFVEGVVVGGEGFGHGATVEGLHDGGFDFDEVVVVHEAAEEGGDS